MRLRIIKRYNTGFAVFTNKIFIEDRSILYLAASPASGGSAKRKREEKDSSLSCRISDKKTCGGDISGIAAIENLKCALALVLHCGQKA